MKHALLLTLLLTFAVLVPAPVRAGEHPLVFLLTDAQEAALNEGLVRHNAMLLEVDPNDKPITLDAYLHLMLCLRLTQMVTHEDARALASPEGQVEKAAAVARVYADRATAREK